MKQFLPGEKAFVKTPQYLDKWWHNKRVEIVRVFGKQAVIKAEDAKAKIIFCDLEKTQKHIHSTDRFI
jgi:hypothetical protein